MRKNKRYDFCRFSPEILREAIDLLSTAARSNKKFQEELYYKLAVYVDGAWWEHDEIEEYYADYRRSGGSSELSYRAKISGYDNGLYLYCSMHNESYTSVTIESNNRSTIESVFDVFERSLDLSRLPQSTGMQGRPTIFIGHGHSLQWRDLKDHLQDKHNFKVESYETGARAGHTIRDILEEMAENSSFALLVLTGDDFSNTENPRARQNVVHETGLFQGKLGFPRAIVLLEDGVEEFSNINGIQQIRFSKGRIRECFGDVLATIRREFGGL